MKVRFWGVRGSIPTPGPQTIKFGGNTSCIEVRIDDGTLIILDAGSGMKDLGRALLASGVKPIVGHILISHTHWDHIQGFPFFTPAFIPGNRFTIYGAHNLDKRLEDALAGQMEHAYFPLRLDQLEANITFQGLKGKRAIIGGAKVRFHYMNHPSVCIGYRITADGHTVAYTTDHEPYSHESPLSHPGDLELVRFVRGADLLIHDSQYSSEEYGSRKSWGHSPLDYVVEVAAAAKVKQLALFHHDPDHSDAVLEGFQDYCRRKAMALAPNLKVFVAAEGMEIPLIAHE